MNKIGALCKYAVDQNVTRFATFLLKVAFSRKYFWGFNFLKSIYNAKTKLLWQRKFFGPFLGKKIGQEISKTGYLLIAWLFFKIVDRIKTVSKKKLPLKHAFFALY